jgi:hypothetical protein
VNSNIYSIKSQYGVKQLDYICNPFTGPPEYRYRPENCASGEATIGDIPQVSKQYPSDLDMTLIIVLTFLF